MAQTVRITFEVVDEATGTVVSRTLNESMNQSWPEVLSLEKSVIPACMAAIFSLGDEYAAANPTK